MPPLATLGLWGDGDEIWAVDEAFQRLGIPVPEEDAPTWYRVGDLWLSAIRVNPELVDNPAAWDEFRQALASETGVNWRQVTKETTLLDGRGHSIIWRLFYSLKQWLRKRHA